MVCIKNNDVRNSKYNLKRRYYYNDPANTALFGKQIPFTGPDTLFRICPSITKWGQFDPNDTFGFAMIKDYMLMRLGETYLLLAEAQFKQGKLQLAADNINVLRQRAFADYPASGKVEASDINLNFILDERASELYWESHRRQDLIRFGKYAGGAYNWAWKGNSQGGISIPSTLSVFPVPNQSLASNANLTQNAGY